MVGPLKSAALDTFLTLVLFVLRVSDPRAPASEYREWLTTMVGMCDPGAYALMFRYVVFSSPRSN